LLGLIVAQKTAGHGKTYLLLFLLFALSCEHGYDCIMRLTFQKITGVQIQASTIFSVFRYPFILKEVAKWMHVDCRDKCYTENLRAKVTLFRDTYFADSVGQELIKKYMFSKFQVLDEGEFMDN